VLPNGQTERPGQLWAALAGKIACWPKWPGPTGCQKEWPDRAWLAWPSKKNSAIIIAFTAVTPLVGCLEKVLLYRYQSLGFLFRGSRLTNSDDR